MSHLIPCPHCGASTAEYHSIGETGEVNCGSCQAYTWGETQEEAEAAWNLRTGSEALVEEILRLKKLLGNTTATLHGLTNSLQEGLAGS